MAGKKCSEGRQRNETIRGLTYARQLGEHGVSLLLGGVGGSQRTSNSLFLLLFGDSDNID